VFAEQRIGGANLKWERRRSLIHTGALAAMALLTVGLLIGWSFSYLRNSSYVTEVDAATQAAAPLVAKAGAASDSELLDILGVLDAVNRLPATATRPAGETPAGMGLGLFQGDKLDAAAGQAYRGLLRDALLPRLARRIEAQLRSQDGSNLEFAYETLKAYLMLGDPAHFDAEALKAWISLDWDRNLPRDVSADQRAALAGHLNQLFADGPVASPVVQDAALVARSREMLLRYTLPDRIYSRLKRQGVGAEIPEFTIERAAGPSATLVFTRKSGAPLTRGIAGLYTYDGYHKGFTKAVDAVSARLLDEEAWVLGTRRERSADAAAVSRDVRRLYLADYARQWEALLADIGLVRAPASARASRSRGCCRGRLAAAQADAGDLPRDHPDPARGRQDHGRPGRRKARQRQAGARQGARPGRGRSGWHHRGPARAPRIHRRRPLRAAAPAGGRRRQGRADRRRHPAPQRRLRAAVGHRDGDQGQGRPAAGRRRRAGQGRKRPAARADPLDAAAALQRRHQPDPRRHPREPVVGGGRPGRAVLPHGHRRPLPLRAQQQPRRDAGRLRPPVRPRRPDRRLLPEEPRPLRRHLHPPVELQAGAGAILGGPGNLAQFQRAATIRDVFFRGGGSVRLDFKPLEMDPAITQFTLDVDGQLVKYAHGPQVPQSIQWPGSKGGVSARIQITPPGPGGTSGQTTEGAWALFRLFDKARVEGLGAPEKFKVTFDVEGRQASFEVTASSVQNPFRLRELAEFRCPGGL
jgi:type VI secretion system protein ImpL